MPETISKEENEEVVETINVSEEIVKTLLAKMKKKKIEKDLEVGSMELQLRDLQEDLHIKSLPFDQAINEMKEEIIKLMPDIARTIKTNDGQAGYRKGSKRISYDAKALDAIKDLDISLAIQPFRKETEVKPSVSIDIY